MVRQAERPGLPCARVAKERLAGASRSEGGNEPVERAADGAEGVHSHGRNNMRFPRTQGESLWFVLSGRPDQNLDRALQNMKHLRHRMRVQGRTVSGRKKLFGEEEVSARLGSRGEETHRAVKNGHALEVITCAHCLAKIPHGQPGENHAFSITT